MSDVDKLQEALSDFTEEAAQREEVLGGYVGSVTAAALVRKGAAKFNEDGTRIVLAIGTHLQILY